jgi:hypothetical protein
MPCFRLPMRKSKMKSKINNNLETPISGWTSLYKLGGISAFLMVGIVVIQLIVFMVAPQPLDGTAIDWFALFQNNKLIGLINFELLMIVYVIISIPIALSLFVLLRRVNRSWTALYLILSLIGVMCFIIARPAFEMLYLSNGYAAAGTNAERAIFLAAGEAKLSAFHGTAFHISYILGSISGLIISLVMLRTNLFSKATSYVRIASSAFDFGLYVPVIGVYIAVFSVLFLSVWNIMIARRLFQFAKETAKRKANPMDRGLLAIPDHSN